MTVRIGFQGVMLFVLYEDCVEVLIPNTEVGPPPDGVRTPHSAWLTSPQPGHTGSYVARHALIGADIDAGAPHAGRPGTAQLVAKVFGIDPVVLLTDPSGALRPRRSPTSRSDADFVGTRLTLRGGHFVVDPVDCNDLEMDIPAFSSPISRTPDTVFWDSAVPSLDLDLSLGRGANMRISLDDSDSPFYVSNLDSRTPEQFVVGFVADPPGTPDSDFRWVYYLYGLSDGSWNPARAASPGSTLPVPVIVRHLPPSVPGTAAKVCLRGTHCMAATVTVPGARP